MSELIEFYHVLSTDALPKPADPTLAGSMPLRAFKYCEPVTAASGFGWYLYPPINFDLKWDGHLCSWRRAQSGRRWTPLRTVVPLDFSDQHKQQAIRTGEDFMGSLPMLSHTPEYGIIQLWSGLVVRTKPGWVSLVRSLVNYPHEDATEFLDGIIETDWWIGPLLSVMRITKSDVSIEFRTSRPFAQLQLVRREAYCPTTMNAVKNHAGLESWPTDVWQGFTKTLSKMSVNRRPGAYKRQVRSRTQAVFTEEQE